MSKVYEIITDKIIEQLKKGEIPWKKPFLSKKHNLVSKRPYQGINLLLLSRVGGYATFRQIQQKGWKLKKGAKSETAVFYKKIHICNGEIIPDKDVEEALNNGETVEEKFMLRYYKVFHEDDIEGIEDEGVLIVAEPNADEIANSYLENEGIELLESNDGRSFYSAKNDTISLPPMSKFTSIEGYYEVLFHEITHSTGAEKRLNRKLTTENMQKYALEELIAEFGSAYLMGETGMEMPTFQNHAAYIQGWVEVLKKDEKILFKAAAKAQKAADFVMSAAKRKNKKEA